MCEIPQTQSFDFWFCKSLIVFSNRQTVKPSSQHPIPSHRHLSPFFYPPLKQLPFNPVTEGQMGEKVRRVLTNFFPSPPKRRLSIFYQ